MNRDDLNELQRTFHSLKNANDDEKEFEKAEDLIIFIRKNVGLDRSVIDRKCAAFLNENDFNEKQRQFIDLVIDFAIRNGNVSDSDFAEEPLCEYSIAELFDDKIEALNALLNLFDRALEVAA